MKIIKPSYEIMTDIDGNEILKKIELCGRTAYKSEDKITNGSAKKFVKMLVERNHESVVEHVSISVRMVVDRGISHELVRHRIASYTQESTRFCNYSGGRFGNELTFIDPCFWKKNSVLYGIWKYVCQFLEIMYLKMIKTGARPEQARSILPNSLKTEIVATMNLREWRHFFRLRTHKSAHPQMREVAIPLLKEFQSKIPIIFDNIEMEV
jgi:thymidylate synthase (FAD)